MLGSVLCVPVQCVHAEIISCDVRVGGIDFGAGGGVSVPLGQSLESVGWGVTVVTTATLARHREQAADLHWLPTGHQEGWEVDDTEGEGTLAGRPPCWVPCAPATLGCL